MTTTIFPTDPTFGHLTTATTQIMGVDGVNPGYMLPADIFALGIATAFVGQKSSVTLPFNGGPIATGVYTLIDVAPFGFTIDALNMAVGNAGGGYTVTVQIIHAGTTAAVSGMNAVAVSSAVRATAAATGANVVVTGDSVAVSIAVTAGAPANAVLSINLTRT